MRRRSALPARAQDTIKRGDLFSQATAKLNEAEGLDNQARSTWLGKGLLRLAKGEIDEAAYQFGAVLGEYEDDVPALLGMANIEYNRKNYKSALRRYKHALRVLPSNMPAVSGRCRARGDANRKPAGALTWALRFPRWRLGLDPGGLPAAAPRHCALLSPAWV